MSAGIKANADGSAAIQVGGSDAITITSGLAVSMNGGVGGLVAGTAVASTSGTSIDFTGIPSWVKRVTVMMRGVSISSTSIIQVQIGSSGTPTTTGYGSAIGINVGSNVVAANTSTTGFPLNNTGGGGATQTWNGLMIITALGSNAWTCAGNFIENTLGVRVGTVAGSVALSGALDIVRITTVNGTDTFDAGSVNIMWE